MIFKQINSGGDRNFSYLIADENSLEGVIIDPSPDPSNPLKVISDKKVKIKYVINTHSHSDHTGGNSEVIKKTGAELVTYKGSGGDIEVGDGALLNVSGLTLEFIYTPGHTADSICIKCEDKVITGDTLFVGKIGGTYSESDAEKEFESLKKLMLMTDDTEVWPGHNYGVKPFSTIGYEKTNNPFIKRLDDFNSFLWLKQNWTSYKIEHGID